MSTRFAGQPTTRRRVQSGDARDTEALLDRLDARLAATDRACLDYDRMRRELGVDKTTFNRLLRTALARYTDQADHEQRRRAALRAELERADANSRGHFARLGHPGCL